MKTAMPVSSNNPPTVGRFAPTPSGGMHLGNLFCAVMAWLAARKENGSFILRIEDLDASRCQQEFADQMEQDLLWLGLTWEEGGSKGGPNPPYYQSKCAPVYEQALNFLSEKGLTYPCFCSRGELHAASAPHRSDGAYLYSGKCRGLTSEQQQELAQKKSPAIRVRLPERHFDLYDLAQGPWSHQLTSGEDFLLRRSDGVFSYQLAVVVDDIRMGVNQIVRGQDLQICTPGQQWLWGQLGGTPARYGHIPMLTDRDGRRLSKRDRDMDLTALRQRFTAQELTGWIGFVAGFLDQPEPLSMAELVPLFRWEHLSKTEITMPESFQRRLEEGL